MLQENYHFIREFGEGLKTYSRKNNVLQHEYKRNSGVSALPNVVL